MAKFTAACVQINSGNDLQANIAKASQLITSAAKQGAKFITLPENAFMMSASREESFKHALNMDEHVAVLAMQKLAAELKVWILFGTHIPAGEKLFNRSVLVNDKGEVAACYDKINLFDVSVAGGESHRESDTFTPGNKPVIAETLGSKVGMVICYDLRFPQLFRALAQNGAEIITVPSAFTHKTGEVHWHVLLRARAIENSCYIIAPGQCGTHPRNRRTYGHSIIIDPWGKILAEASEDKEEVVLAEIDTAYVAEVRKTLPGFAHNPSFKF